MIWKRLVFGRNVVEMTLNAAKLSIILYMECMILRTPCRLVDQVQQAGFQLRLSLIAR